MVYYGLCDFNRWETTHVDERRGRVRRLLKQGLAKEETFLST